MNKRYATNPTMKAVKTRKRPASEPDERVIPSSENPHDRYVGERKVTRSI